MTSKYRRVDLDSSFRSAMERLRRSGRLVEHDEQVDPVLEIAGMLKQNDGDKAHVFTHVKGYDTSVVGNFLASEENCQVAFNLDRNALREAVARGLNADVPPVVVKDGPVLESVVRDNIDIEQMLPALQHAPGDAGKFITAGVVIARHPISGVLNASFHRLQLQGGNKLAIQIDMGRHLRSAFEAAKSRGKNLPISISIGPDLALLYSAATMGARMPESRDELSAAGAMRGKPLEVLDGMTQDVPIPADCEIALEGEISTSHVVDEGPFGEFVGYHSTAGPAPLVNVTAVMHRSDPWYHAINGAGIETVMLRKYVLETSLLTSLQPAYPIVEDVNLTPGGLYRFHANILVRKSQKSHDGLQRNAAILALSTLKDLNRVVVVGDDIDITSPTDVEYAISTRVNPDTDLLVLPGLRGHEYVRWTDGGVGAKWIIDATVPFELQDQFRRISFAQVNSNPGEEPTRNE